MRLKNNLRFIKTFCRLLRHRIKCLKWLIQFYKVKYYKLYPQHLIKLEVELSDKVIILAPHADDEWIGPYSLINLKKQGIKVVYFNLFGGNNDNDNLLTRNAEILASSKYWNFDLINNYNYDVNSLYYVLKNSTICFLPSPYDWHDEHRNVFQTFVQAYDRLNEEQRSKLVVYYYCVSVPHICNQYLYYLPLSRNEVLEKWRQFFKIYRSQSFMPAFRYILQLKLVPSFVGDYAQTYIKAESDRLKKDYEMSKDLSFIKFITKSKLYIDDIYKIRKYINMPLDNNR